jgi:hypothetical protein
LSVNGVAIPDEVNSDPTIEVPEIVTGAVPVEDRVNDCEAVWPAITLPKFTAVVLALSVGTPPTN